MTLKKHITLLFILTCFVGFSQKHTKLLKKLETFDNYKQYDKVEKEILSATEHILFEPYSVKDKDKMDAIKAVEKWIVFTDGVTFPVIGKLYNSIKDNEYLVSLYKVSMANYILDQKINFNRIITCDINPPKGKTYLEQNDVRELHYESAIIFIKYLKSNNELNNGKDFKLILDAYNKDNLRNFLFNEK